MAPVLCLYIGAVLLGMFLIGGIPFGFLAGKCNGVDIRTLGSGNIGATNVFRTIGKKWGSVVFTLDFLKAFLPLLLLKSLLPDILGDAFPVEVVLILGGVACVLGHNYCPYLGFKGGKGMATSAGFLFALLPWSGLLTLLLWALVFGTSRIVSLASIVASAGLPLITFFVYPGHWWLVGLSLFLGVMGVWRHRANIRRLLDGTEHSFKKAGEEKS